MTAVADRLRSLIELFAVHGGRIDLARGRFGDGDWLDLSTGISPWAFPFDLPAEVLTRLPSPTDLAELEAAAAACFGSPPAMTIAVPGSDFALRAIGHLLAVKEPAAVTPGYSGHVAMWPSACRHVRFAPTELIAAARTCGALVLARPGNPGGEIAEEQVLQAMSEELAAHGGWLIVDEAFADAEPATSLAARDWPNLVVLRSFGKFAGLAGLRLGFVIAPPALAGRLRARLGDWPISGPALVAGLAFYRDLPWQDAQRERLVQSGRWLDGVLHEAVLTITARTPFYRSCAAANAWALFEHLCRHRVLVRPFRDDPHRLRFGLPENRAAADRLAAALAAWSDT